MSKKGDSLMEIGLQKADTAFLRKRETGGVTFEAESETVVPDVMPDVGEIIYASGIPLLRSKTISDGKITVTGSIQAQLLYVPETDTGINKLELEIPFRYVSEAEVFEDSQITVVVRLAYVDARALNPRKLSVRCELCAELSVYDTDRLELGAVLLPEAGSEICTKQETVTAELVSGVYEKSFIVTDSYPISGALTETVELLGKSVKLNGEDVKYVGTKMIVKGLIQTELIWQTEESEISTSSFSSGFSQILEIGELEEPSADVSLLLSGAYFELSSASGSCTVTAELHVLAQVVCTQRKAISYISDVYSNRFPLQTYYGEPQTLSSSGYELRRDSMRGVLDTPWPVREIVSVSESAGLWSAAENGYSCPINVRLLLRSEDGALHGLVRSFAAKWEVPLCDDISETIGSVVCEELTAVPTTDGVEIRILAAAKFRQSICKSITPLQSVEADESERIDLSAFPSVTVLPCRDGDLWTLAKRYHSTVELIEEVNRENGTSVLLIQRAR